MGYGVVITSCHNIFGGWAPPFCLVKIRAEKEKLVAQEQKKRESFVQDLNQLDQSILVHEVRDMLRTASNLDCLFPIQLPHDSTPHRIVLGLYLPHRILLTEEGFRSEGRRMVYSIDLVSYVDERPIRTDSLQTKNLSNRNVLEIETDIVEKAHHGGVIKNAVCAIYFLEQDR